MIYPYELYLRAMLLRGYDNLTVTNRLRAVRLAPPSEDELDSKREEILDLLPDAALTLLTPGPRADFNAFMKKYGKKVSALGIDDILDVLQGQRNKCWEDALLLIADVEYRLPIMTMLLYGDTTAEIADYLENKHKLEVTLESVEMFKAYFWDTGKMTKLEIYSYISMVDGPKVREALLDAFHKKTSKLRWKISGENMLTLEDILATVMNEAFEKFKSSVIHDDDNAVMKTVKWADLAIKAAEKFAKLSQKDAASAIAELQFKLNKISQKDIKEKDDFDGEVA